MYSENDKERTADIIAFLVTSIGGIVVLGAMISVSYTQILPLSYLALAVVSFLLSTFIGTLNEDPKKSIYALTIAVVGAVFLTSLMRSMPALIGIIPAEPDLFIFAQVTKTLPIFFIVAPLCLLGNTFGILINEFVLKPRYPFR